MRFPKPQVGQVVRVNFQFGNQPQKERPAVCVVVGVNPGKENDDTHVLLLPISSTFRRTGDISIKIPEAAKRQLGLDDRESHIILTEVLELHLPGYDQVPVRKGKELKPIHGQLTPGVMSSIRKMIAVINEQNIRLSIVQLDDVPGEQHISEIAFRKLGG